MIHAEFDPERDGAFGAPDGSRSRIEGPTFVELDPAVAQAGLVSERDDRNTRVIVGRKGSGKTLYLRRLQDSADEEQSVYASKLDPKTPLTHHIRRFCEWYEGDDLTERWSEAWRAAILRSACSHLLYARSLRGYGVMHRKPLQRAARELMPKVGTPRTVYDQLSSLINAPSRARLDRELSDERWGDLEYWLGQAIQDAPPLYFYLDAVDEEYAQAPHYWLRCQKGLFYQVMRFLRDPVFGGRLHIVIAIRDNVFASVLRGEHATRYRTDPHIRILAWDRPAIGFFLQRKLERLSRENVVCPSASPNVSDWLGASTIYNEGRKLEEDLESYLLRHTRMLPRDIVLLGNELSDEVARVKQDGGTQVPAKRIRQIVSYVAAWCGNEQLAVCANQVLGETMPRRRSHDVSRDYTRLLNERIGELIRALGADVFDHEALARLDRRGREAFRADVDLPTILWQNGLLGYGDGSVGVDEWIFHGVEDIDRFHIPLDRERYALHPCLLDALGFKSHGAGTRPVHPWRRGATS